jgi:thiol-disulfide isomerase/thioredoxin
MKRLLLLATLMLIAAAGAFAADTKIGSELRFAPSTGSKVIFTSEAEAHALAEKGPTVLFFAADWCPYCQADLRDINAHGDRMKDITIVVVDYDRAAGLKNKYAVTAQDTFVQIDARGGELAVWNGGGVDGILAHVVRG